MIPTQPPRRRWPHSRNHPRRKRQRRRKRPVIRFTPTAWAKLLHLRDLGSTDRVERGDPWVTDFRTFCERWRLQTLAAPSLPIPLEPQVPSLRPAHPAPPGTVTAFFPDTSPTLGRGVLDEALEDALHSSPPEHLAEWIALVSKDTRAKTQIAVYERRFCLQHFWRLLHARFPEALRRKKTVLRGVFADFLSVSDDSIKDDLRHITQRLDTGWAQRPLLPR